MKKKFEWDFIAQNNFQGGYNSFNIFPALIFIVDNQCKDNLPNINLKGWKEYSLWLDFLWFGLSISLTVNNR